MGWQIAQKAGKFRIWSTTSDVWLTDWITREEAIKFYYDDALLAFKNRIIEKYFSFPHHWLQHDNRHGAVIVNQEGSARYLAWLNELIHKPDEEYTAFVNETFEQIMKDIHEQS
jgi:hypothetical protein